ncbi:hypothetical protein ADUPG1_003767, partial [Aduncisulcus paluster]
REKAKKAIDALFASQTTQNLYDRLIALKMTKFLDLDDFLRYSKEFKTIRGRSPSLGTQDRINEIFIGNFRCERLRQCVTAELSDEAPLSEVIATTTRQIARLKASELEYRVMRAQRSHKELPVDRTVRGEKKKCPGDRSLREGEKTPKIRQICSFHKTSGSPLQQVLPESYLHKV